MRGGDLPAVDSPEHEVVVVTTRGSAEAAHRVTQLMTDSIPRALGIAAEDIQIVTPVHKGPAGTIELNRALKAKLNPGPGAHRGFDPGDRVVAVANHADDGFANGEVGTVVTAEGDGLTVSFSGLPVTVPFRLLADLRHGWAITVHRAQGSEWPAVVAVFPAEATGMLSRPAGLHRPDPRAAPPVRGARRRPGAGPRGAHHRRAPPGDPAGRPAHRGDGRGGGPGGRLTAPCPRPGPVATRLKKF